MNPESRTIPFVKASACGNDFLLIDSALAPPDIAAFTRRICDRHEGVGADGVEWMSPHSSADAEIRLINADGSEAEISGNGTRCVAAYLASERGLETITIQTGAGQKVCSLTGRQGTEYEFEIEMGEAAVGNELVLETSTGPVRGIPVSMGNPHYVRFLPGFSENWRTEAAEIQRNPFFKQGVNVELVVIDNKHNIRTLFFERGVGETQSSGTGSCAAAMATMASGLAESPVRVHAAGGVQAVRSVGNQVFLRGPARLVFEGEYFLN